MSATRKILLALSILFGLLGVFRAYDVSHFAETDSSLWLGPAVTLLIASGLGVVVILTGRKDAPQALVRLGRMRAGVTAAALFGLLSGAVVVGAGIETVEQHQHVMETEARLVETKRKLETFEFDRNGNVPPGKNMEFSMLITEAKLLPSSLAQSTGDRTTCALITFAAMAALGLSFYFGRRSWMRSSASPSAPTPMVLGNA
ncbi:MAG: hypothetical protein HOV80_26880 [Polyangiaceae bacterium]|nr:hypothetical protein [Polyangiaceae bacterium]